MPALPLSSAPFQWEPGRPRPERARPTARGRAGSQRRNQRLLIWNVALELFDPNLGARVAGRAPIGPWRERPSGAHFRTVRHGGALELTGREESLEKNAEPLLDLREVVFAPGG